MKRRMVFDQNPMGYDRYRPDYVKELFDEIFRYAGLNASMRVLEIGIGTGLATLPILEAGCSVTAVEPGKNLASYASIKFRAHKNFKAVCCDFEDFEPDERYDLIYSATAFHWIPEEAGFPKIYRLLKPGGAVALFWNRPFVARTDDPLHMDIQNLYQKYGLSDALPVEFSEKDCRKTLDALERYGFSDIKVQLFHRTRTMSAEDYIGLLSTYSDHVSMGKDDWHKFAGEVMAAINTRGGVIRIYDTMDLYLARTGGSEEAQLGGLI
jgi:SAM-dependent methyltransferase